MLSKPFTPTVLIFCVYVLLGDVSDIPAALPKYRIKSFQVNDCKFLKNVRLYAGPL
jgi:hypothetical protein